MQVTVSAEQLTPSQQRPASPCVGVCRIEQASGLCAGCLRTLDEIAAWSKLDETGRERVWVQLDERRLPGARRAA
ncbi:DUF1289 domain-containing protein [Methylibium petroleiphilum]|nr:DUF1289 domain-containing protein [Methylibium petroleiphilum]